MEKVSNGLHIFATAAVAGAATSDDYVDDYDDDDYLAGQRMLAG
jgi:hypothetical protein